MQWAQISRNWEAFTPAIIDHWPEAEEDDVLALDGTATSLAMYLSEVTGEPATDTLARVAMMMASTLGGMIGARLDPARITPMESFES